MARLADAVAKLLDCDAIDNDCWDELELLLEPLEFPALWDTPQNPVFHGEGNAMAHTRLVCRELCALDGFRALAREGRETLLLATLLHDVGKLRTTRFEDGRWRSPNHAMVGSKMVRTFLWRDCGLCGTIAAQRLRETVCLLVRHHMRPSRLVEQDEPTRFARRLAAVGELAPAFTWGALCLLGEADVRGRVACDVGELVEQVDLCKLLAEESGCLLSPYPFCDTHTRRAYLAGRNVQANQPLYDDTWGEVVLMCGLPGTGKDTWIGQNLPDLPMVSLDAIRQELRINPTDTQGRVVQEAQELARRLLRSREAFVWNATNTRADTRKRLVTLCEAYHASVRIVYLETSWDEQLKRNAKRDAAVPKSVLDHMAMRIEPPLPDEARTVEWQVT